MSNINQKIIDVFVKYLKKEKYKTIIQELNLEYCSEDKKNIHLYLAKIIIRKRKRNNGYGKLIMADIINLSIQYNIKIKLYPSHLLGSDLERLKLFYINLGFIYNPIDENMIFIPKK